MIKARRAKWVAHWKDGITAIMNDHRNFTVNQTFVKLQDFVKKDGLEMLPTEKELKEIVLRDRIPLEEPGEEATPEVKAAFLRRKMHCVLYHNVLLPCVAGASSYWREGVRLNQTITEAKLGNVECVPPGSEAMTLLIFENSRQRWAKIWKEENSDCGRKEFKVPKSQKDDQAKQLAKQFATKYTSSTVGNAKYGGWSNEGRQRYAHLKTQIERAREQDKANGFQVEKLYLKWTLESLGKGDHQPDPEACQGKKRKKKRNYDDLFDCV